VKASANQIAKRYVQALFDVAGDNVRAKVEKDLKQLDIIVKGSDLFRDLLANPLLTRAQQAQAMESVLEAISADKITRQFIALLAARKRLSIIPEIIEQFLTKAAEARGEVSAELISAVPLKSGDVASVGERLGKVFGKKVQLETRQDPALLGGVVVKIGSMQFDSSLSGKMRRLQNKLKAA